MRLKREEKLRRLKWMQDELITHICSGDYNQKGLKSPLCPLYEIEFKGIFWKDIKKSRYFCPIMTLNREVWFDSDIDRLHALNDLIDMYTGYYSPTLKERIKNVSRYICFWIKII